MEKNTSSKRYSLITKLICLCIVLAVMSVVSPCHAFRNLKEGQAMPEFSLKGIDGRLYDRSSIKDKICLITYFRSDQQRSEKALLALKALAEKFSGQPLVFLAITKDADKGSVENLNGTLKLPFPILYDEKSLLYKDLGVFVFPVTAIFDREMLLSYQYAGFRDDFQDELSGQIRLLLGLVTKEELAKEHLKKGLQQSESQKKSNQHLNLGIKLYSKGMTEKASLEFEKALELDPENTDANIEMGYCLLEQKSPDKAIAFFEKALRLNQRSADAKIGLGMAYRLQGKTKDALEILKSAIVLSPDSSKIHLELGKIYESLGEKEEALQHYKKAATCAMDLEKRRR
jgi:Tfp pilus assembly protein PilF/peroxiredoxin